MHKCSKGLPNQSRYKHYIYIFLSSLVLNLFLFLGNMTVSNELKELDRSKISNMMNFLTKYENLLGPNNHHIVEIKFAIVMILANRKPYTLDNLTQEELELKERLAAQKKSVNSGQYPV